jgi:hypothetical protein
MGSKRGRDDIEADNVSIAAMELESTLSRGLEMKLRVIYNPEHVSIATLFPTNFTSNSIRFFPLTGFGPFKRINRPW